MSTLSRLSDRSVSIVRSLQAHEAGFASLKSGDDVNSLALSPKEEQILDFHDELQRMELEVAVLKSLGRERQDDIMGPLEPEVEAAERELLEAKAAYSLKSNIIQSVLIADPILKAVHSGANASLAEQRLRPLIHRRDTLSISLAQLADSLASSVSALSKTQTESIVSSEQNAALAQSLLSLAEEVKIQREDITDVKDQRQLQNLEKDIKVRRLRWKMLKSVVSAIVAGSGIDWVNDEALLNLVIDEED